VSRDFSKHVVSNVLDDGSIEGWHVPNLWKYTEGMKSHRVATSGLYKSIKQKVYDTYTDKDWEQVKNADLSYPIIRHHEMGIIDGMHRTVKAHNEGIAFMNVIDIKDMPKPDYHWKNEFEYESFFKQ
jgi:hypothetical protein